MDTLRLAIMAKHKPMWTNHNITPHHRPLFFYVLGFYESARLLYVNSDTAALYGIVQWETFVVL